MFSQHPKAIFWSDRNEKKPDEVSLNSHKKFWFDCECGHTFDIQLNNVNSGRWCSYCSNKKLCGQSKNCKICFDKCFASVDYFKNWSDKNIETPFEVLKNSHKKYWFECPKCEHSFQQQLSNITRGNMCQYCHNLIMCKDIHKWMTTSSLSNDDLSDELAPLYYIKKQNNITEVFEYLKIFIHSNNDGTKNAFVQKGVDYLKIEKKH